MAAPEDNIVEIGSDLWIEGKGWVSNSDPDLSNFTERKDGVNVGGREWLAGFVNLSPEEAEFSEAYEAQMGARRK